MFELPLFLISASRFLFCSLYSFVNRLQFHYSGVNSKISFKISLFLFVKSSEILCRRSATKEVLFEWHLRCLSTSIHRCKSNFDKSFTITSPRCERKWRNDATSLCHILCFLAPFSLDSRQYIYKVLFLPWTSLFSCFTGVYNLKGLCYVSLLAIFLTS